MKLPELEMKTHSELVRGEPLRIYNRYLIPIYRVDATIFGGPRQMIWAEVDPKGLVIVEKPKTCYISLDEEQMQVSTLAKTIPDIESLINRLRQSM